MTTKKRICSECENYKFGSTAGPISGYCLVYPLDEPNTYKEVRFNTDATNCPKFQEATELMVMEAETESQYHPRMRLYGEIEEEKKE